MKSFREEKLRVNRKWLMIFLDISATGKANVDKLNDFSLMKYEKFEPGKIIFFLFNGKSTQA